MNRGEAQLRRVTVLDGGGFSPPYDFSLVSGLRSAGVSVQLAMPAQVLRDWEDPDAHPIVSQSALLRASRKAGTAFSYATRLGRLALDAYRSRIDVLHLQWLPVPVLDVRVLGALKGRVPLVYTMHNTSNFHESDRGFRNRGKRTAYTLFDRIIVHSQYSRQSALHSGVARADQLRVIPHGAFEYYKSLVTKARSSQGPVQLLFAGSIKAYKGLDILIEALPQLAANTAAGSWHLTIAGHAGMPLAALQARVRDLGVHDSVTWTLRHQTERELANLFEASHAVLLPYREIDQSGVLLAAVGMHRAVVASRVGAFPEIVQDGEHGLLVPPVDVDALGRALVTIVSDHDLRLRSEQAMRELAGTSLHWSRIAGQTIALYQELADSQK
jgi:glycosyltransferase involved in cell wall biosynthesis